MVTECMDVRLTTLVCRSKSMVYQPVGRLTYLQNEPKDLLPD